MAKAASTRYKDTLAAPGSELHRLLTEGKAKEAEASYRATEQRARDLLTDPRTRPVDATSKFNYDQPNE